MICIFLSSAAGECEDATPDHQEGVVIRTANKACTLHLEARPLPLECVALLESNTHLLKALNLVQGTSNKQGKELDKEGSNKEEAELNNPGTQLNKKGVKLNKDTLQELEDLRTRLDSALSSNNFEGAVDRVWCFGPRQTGCNLLINAVPGYDRPSLWSALKANSRQPLREYDNSIVSGFQLATLAGPLCEEPMRGVCFIVKGWDHQRTSQPEQLNPPDQPNLSDQFDLAALPDHQPNPSDQPILPDQPVDSESLAGVRSADSYGPFSGQLISAMKEGCRRSFLAQPARLMAAMYSSNILATADVLGKVYSVLGRRNGRVLSEEMKEGSAMFTIQALVPVAESFGFVEEIRKRTSGLANPQLIFSHWEVSKHRHLGCTSG